MYKSRCKIDYRVATLSKSYLITYNSNMPKLTKKAFRYGRTYGVTDGRTDGSMDGPTLIIEKLRF